TNTNPPAINLGLNTFGTQRVFGGTFDEFAIWNKTLNSSEITQLYNDGDGITYDAPTGDVGVVLISPTNNTLTTLTEIEFNVNQTATDTYNNSNSTLYVWNSSSFLITSNTTELSGNGSALITWNVSGFDDGSYLWNAFACGQNGTTSNCSWSTNGNFTFEVDTS